MEKRNKWDIVGHIKDYMAERRYRKDDFFRDVSYLSSLPDNKKEKYIDRNSSSEFLYELLKDASDEMKEKYIEYISESRYMVKLLQTMPTQMQEKYVDKITDSKSFAQLLQGIPFELQEKHITKVLDTNEGIEILSKMPENVILDNIARVRDASKQYALIKDIPIDILMLHLGSFSEDTRKKIVQGMDNDTIIKYLPEIDDSYTKTIMLQDMDEEVILKYIGYIGVDAYKLELLEGKSEELISSCMQYINNDGGKVRFLGNKSDTLIEKCIEYIDDDYNKAKLLQDKSEECIAQCIKYIDDDYKKAELLQDKSEECIAKCIQYIDSDYDKAELLQDKSEECIAKCIQYIDSDYKKAELLQDKSEELVRKCIDYIDDTYSKAAVLQGKSKELIDRVISLANDEQAIGILISNASRRLSDSERLEIMEKYIYKMTEEKNVAQCLKLISLYEGNINVIFNNIEKIQDDTLKAQLITDMELSFREEYTTLEVLNNINNGIINEDEIESCFFSRYGSRFKIKEENKLKLILAMPQTEREKLIWTLTNDEDKMTVISTLDEKNTSNYIKYLKSYEHKMELASRLPENEREIVINQIEEHNRLNEHIKKLDNNYDKEKYIQQLPVEQQIHFITYYPDCFPFDFMNKLPIEEREQYIHALGGSTDSFLTYYIDYLPKDIQLKYIQHLTHYGDKINRLLAIEDKEILKAVMFNKVKLSCRPYLTFNDTEFVRKNIEDFLKLEVPGIDSEYTKQVIEQMYKTNDEVYINLDFRMLDKKYVDILGIDKINQISCYRNMQQSILKLSENELNVFTKSLNSIANKNYAEDWNKILSNMLSNLHGLEYEELMENIKDDSSIDVDKLTKIMQFKNMFQISTKEDIENYETIKQEKTDEWIKSDDIDTKKKAVLAKAFGHDEQYAQNILKKYSLDIDKLPDSEMKYYVKILQELSNIDNPEVYQKIYDIVTNIDFANPIKIERMLTTEYYKTYPDVLFDPKTANEIEHGIYDAGTNFSMIMTALSPFSRNDDIGTENFNYKDNWNRPKLSTPHFCCSYIRNDMMGTAPIGSICYGFNSMQEDSLVCSGSYDIYSNNDAITTEASGEEYYLSHDTQIDRTVRYNEMDFRRTQHGDKVGPDYIIVFKENGEIKNLDMAKKAQEDWEGIPIVVIDKQACLDAEKEKVEQLKEQFNQATSEQEKEDIAIEIIQKVRNNMQTSWEFSQSIDLSSVLDVDIKEIVNLIENQLPPSTLDTTHAIDFGEIKTHIKTDIEKSKDENKVEEKTQEEISLVGIEDFEKCDEQVNAQERLEMQELFIKIIKIKEKEENMQSKEVEYDGR